MKLRESFSHKSLSSRVVEYLKEEIFMENYRGGDRILESRVAEELEISRAPVREALKELENQGLVNTIPRKGTFVVEFNQEEMQELFDIRVTLESRVFKILIKEKILTEEDFKYLNNLVEEMVKIAQSDEDDNYKILLVNRKDMKFHRYLWCKSNSKWTIKILTTLYNQLQLAMIMDAKKENNLTEASLKHKDILQRLKEYDLTKTKAAIIDHIRTLSQQL